MERFQGKLAIVTGASAGIGAALCIKLVEAGLKVIGIARNQQRIEELKEKLNVTSKERLIGIKCDLTKDEEVIQTFNQIKQNFGPIHILINNAGMNTHHTLLDGKPSDWRRIMDLNVVSVCLCTNQAIQSMRTNNIDDGHIININSGYGHTFVTRDTAHFYSASKHALRAITEGYRQELRALNTHIRVSSVSPGIVWTEFLGREMEDKESAENVYKNCETTLYSDDVAANVIHAISAPPHVNVNEIIISPI